MKRQRGRNRRSNNSGNNNNNNPNRSFDSNGPDIKVRGNAKTIYEKYTTLARDAASGGSRVKAENYLQHAEHYLRVMKEQQAKQQAAQEQRAAEQEARQEREADKRAAEYEKAPKSESRKATKKTDESDDKPVKKSIRRKPAGTGAGPEAAASLIEKKPRRKPVDIADVKPEKSLDAAE